MLLIIMFGLIGCFPIVFFIFFIAIAIIIFKQYKKGHLDITTINKNKRKNKKKRRKINPIHRLKKQWEISPLPIITLIVFNLLTIIGAVAQNWSSYEILMFYWFETAIIMFYTILKMLITDNTKNQKHKNYSIKTPKQKNNIDKYFKSTGKIVIILFLIMHMSIFMMGHYIFINTFFSDNSILSPMKGFSSPISGKGTFEDPLIIKDKQTIETPNISQIYSLQNIIMGGSIFFVLLFISHGISFKLNYVDKKEYKKTTLSKLLFHPYKRITIMHIIIIFGGIFLAGNIIILIILKTIIDVLLHAFSHSNSKQDQIIKN